MAQEGPKSAPIGPKRVQDLSLRAIKEEVRRCSSIPEPVQRLV